MKHLNQSFQNSQLFEHRLNRYREIATQNEHVHAIFCRPGGAVDVISGANIRTIEGYIVINFEVATSISFREIQKQTLRDGGGGGHRR